MQNNESKESLNDDFWKILSESDDGEENGIDILLKSRGSSKSKKPEPSIKEIQNKDLEAFCVKEAEKSSEMGSQSVQGYAGSSEKWSTMTVGNTATFEEKTEVSIDSGPKSDSKLGTSKEFFSDEEEDFFVSKISGSNTMENNTERKASPVKDSSISIQDGNDSCITQSSAKMSVDEMDFLWDDDEEGEFIVEKINQISVSKDKDASTDVFSEVKEKEIDQNIREEVEKESPIQEMPLPLASTMEEAEVAGENIIATSPPDEPVATISPPVDTDIVATPIYSGPPGQAILQEAKFNPLKPKPLSKFICGSLVTTFMVSQKRFNMQGEATKNNINVTEWHRIGYSLPDIKPSKFISQLSTDADDTYYHVYKLVQLKDPHVESIMELIPDVKPIYAHEGISSKVDSTHINTFIDLCFKNEDKALEYAVENRMWAFALLLPKRDKGVAAKFLETFCDPTYVPFLSATLGLSFSSFQLGENWKSYLRQLLSTRNSTIIHDFILQLSKQSIADALFVTLSCHFLKLIDINQYLWMFSKNFEVLRILCYVEYMSKCIKDLDLFKYEFVSVGIEFDRAKAEEYFNANKKCFRKELIDSLGSIFDTKWSFGLKSVFDFGLKKILDVEDLDGETKKKPSGKEVLEQSSVKPAVHEEVKPKLSSITGNRISIQRPNLGMSSLSSPNSDKLVNKCAQPLGYSDEVKPAKDSPIQKKMYTLSKSESVLNHGEICQAKEEKEISIDGPSPSDVKESNALYTGNQQSKSFADFFSNDKPEKEIRSEDDTSLFLSKFTEDDDISNKTEKEPLKKNSSFFGFLNMFKKEPVHKVKIDADDDFKYDPVSKKWISSSSNGSKTESSPVLKPQSVPMPVLGDRRPSTQEFDVDETSMYANRKSAGNKSIPGALNKKK